MLAILVDETAVMSIQRIFCLTDYGLREGKHTSYVRYGAAHNIIITLSKEEIHTNVKNMNARRINDARVSNKIEPVERDAAWWS
jgi:hypothetical protein